jgi:hypothetical protein
VPLGFSAVFGGNGYFTAEKKTLAAALLRCAAGGELFWSGCSPQSHSAAEPQPDLFFSAALCVFSARSAVK